MSVLPGLILVPLVAAFVIALAGENLRRLGAGLIVAVSGFLAVFSLRLGLGLQGTIQYTSGHGKLPGLMLMVDGLSAFMLCVMNLVAFFVAIYSVAYARKYVGQWKFFCLFSLFLTGINGVLIAGDLFNLYLFLEVVAVTSYFLVAFGTDAEGLEASFKYAVMGAVASAFILLGLALFYLYAGTLNLPDMASVIMLRGVSKPILFIIVLFIMGFGLKASFVPFHAWLPYAHSAAPAPVSAMLSGVSIKVLGLYAISRLFFNVIGINPQIAWTFITIGTISMVAASTLAFAQTDLKRLYAYSSIGQVGYIALGLGIGTPMAISGALLHLMNHSFSKSLLFLASGRIEEAMGTRDIRKIEGLTATEPVAGYGTLVGALSISGMPPFGGFWSKFMIIFGCVQGGHPVFAMIAAFTAILTLAYYFRALSPVLFGVERAKPAKRAGALIAVPLSALAILALIGSCILFPGPFNRLFNEASRTLLSGPQYLSQFSVGFKS